MNQELVGILADKTVEALLLVLVTNTGSAKNLPLNVRRKCRQCQKSAIECASKIFAGGGV